MNAQHDPAEPDESDPTSVNAYAPPGELVASAAPLADPVARQGAGSHESLYAVAAFAGLLNAVIQSLLFNSEAFFGQYPILSLIVAPAMIIGISTFVLLLMRNAVRARIGTQPAYLVVLIAVSGALGIVLLFPTCFGILIIAGSVGGVMNFGSSGWAEFASVLIASAVVYVPIMLLLVRVLPQFRQPRPPAERFETKS